MKILNKKIIFRALLFLICTFFGIILMREFNLSRANASESLQSKFMCYESETSLLRDTLQRYRIQTFSINHDRGVRSRSTYADEFAGLWYDSYRRLMESGSYQAEAGN